MKLELADIKATVKGIDQTFEDSAVKQQKLDDEAAKQHTTINAALLREETTYDDQLDQLTKSAYDYKVAQITRAGAEQQAALAKSLGDETKWTEDTKHDSALAIPCPCCGELIEVADAYALLLAHHVDNFCPASEGLLHG